jgi:hypothetical protein
MQDAAPKSVKCGTGVCLLVTHQQQGLEGGSPAACRYLGSTLLRVDLGFYSPSSQGTSIHLHLGPEPPL